jgi:hypothetical protein
MDNADSRPVSSGYKFDLYRIRRSAASWPALLTVLLAWVTLRNRVLSGLNRKPLRSEHEAIEAGLAICAEPCSSRIR